MSVHPLNSTLVCLLYVMILLMSGIVFIVTSSPMCSASDNLSCCGGKYQIENILPLQLLISV